MRSIDTRQLTIAYVGGGSKGWAWGLMSDLAVEADLGGQVKLYDIDLEAAKKNELIGNTISQCPEASGKWRYQAVDSLREALTGADFVVISILPGTFREMASDVHTPERYGIYQSVGDTTGPGGLVRALRTIPMYIQIAEAIRDHAPDAWVINYTNPMALCVRTLYEVYPGIKAVGCCHEVFGAQELLAHALREQAGVTGVRREEIEINVLGINHFTWIDAASYKTMDLMPVYREFVDRFYDTGYEEPGSDGWRQAPFGSANRVKFDLFRRYGLIAAAGDRHLAEFVPWYLRDPESVASWKFHLTDVKWRIDNKKRLDKLSDDIVSGREKPRIHPSGEEGVRQIKALLGMGPFVTNMNLPNRGQMQGLPLGTVVETNALLSRNSARPLMAGSLPADVQRLVARHALNYETLLHAVILQDKELALQAFLNDPLVTCDPADARELFQAMLANTREYLPAWLL